MIFLALSFTQVLRCTVWSWPWIKMGRKVFNEHYCSTIIRGQDLPFVFVEMSSLWELPVPPQSSLSSGSATACKQTHCACLPVLGFPRVFHSFLSVSFLLVFRTVSGKHSGTKTPSFWCRCSSSWIKPHTLLLLKKFSFICHRVKKSELHKD